MKRNIRDLKVGDKLRFGKDCSLGFLKAGNTYMVNNINTGSFGYQISVEYKYDGESYNRYLVKSHLNHSKVKLVTND